jgi:hypothetical protein
MQTVAIAPSTRSPPSPVSSPPGEDISATFSGILLRHSLIQSRAFLRTGSVSPSTGGEGWGEDGRSTNFINDIVADL